MGLWEQLLAASKIDSLCSMKNICSIALVKICLAKLSLKGAVPHVIITNDENLHYVKKQAGLTTPSNFGILNHTFCKEYFFDNFSSA